MELEFKTSPESEGILEGSSTFFELKKNSTCFIDNTELIHYFLSRKSVVTAILYPRRFGKSTNLDMVRCFLEMNYKNPDDVREIFPYYFGGRIMMMDGPLELKEALIAKDPISQHHFCKYPVIYLDFKSCSGINADNIIKNLIGLINEEFTRHDYLEESNSISPNEKEKLSNFIKNKKLEHREIVTSFKFLSQLLTQHWKRKVLVFIDEYDHPISQVYLIQQASQKETYRNQIQLVVGLFQETFSNLLKNNDKNIEKAMITGVMDIKNAGFLSSLNNLDQYNVYEPDYTKDFYGFSEENVRFLMNGLNLDPNYFPLIKEWYNGYICVIGKKPYYNTWSIVKCFNKIIGMQSKNDKETTIKHSFRSFWKESGDAEILLNFIKIPIIQKHVLGLIGEEKYECSKDIEITKENFLDLMEKAKYLKWQIQNPEKSFVDLLFSLFLVSGYLTIAEESDKDYFFKIPNSEIKRVFEKNLIRYFCDSYVNFGPACNALKNIINTDKDLNNGHYRMSMVEDFRKEFSILLKSYTEFAKSMENVQEGVIANEDIIHSLMVVIGLNCKGMIVGSELWYKKESRLDVILVSKIYKKCLIFEIKFEGSAKIALNQIKNRNYANILKQHEIKDIKDVLMVGMNVTFGKNVTFEQQMK